MFAAARAGLFLRNVIPYAQWTVMVVQLGYFGYNLWTMYTDYVRQVERDQRAGVNRDFNETMELVVKPRRKRQYPNATVTTSDENPSNQEERSGETNADPVASTSQETNNLTQSRENDENNPTPELQEQADSEDLTIVYDSNINRANSYLSTTAATTTGTDAPSHPLDELVSNASTSMESTDSSKGILHDIYKECFICARTLDDSTKPVARLPFCMHPFHQTCLDSVLKWHPKCPVCDFHIFSPI